MTGARFLDPSSIPLKRQSGGNIWSTLASITQAVIFVILLSGLTLFFFPVIQRTHDLKAKKAQLEASIAQAEAEQEKLQIQTEHMKNDPAYIEHMARDGLNMGRPGETILRFDPYPPENSDTKTAPAESDTDPAP
jgi:cell division protein FtsB